MDHNIVEHNAFHEAMANLSFSISVCSFSAARTNVISSEYFPMCALFELLDLFILCSFVGCFVCR